MLLIALFMALIGFTAAANLNLTNFYLVTTTSPAYFNTPAALPDVSALSLFNPYYVSWYELRLIDPGYNSIPTFSLSENNSIYTEASGPHGQGFYTYYSSAVVEGGLLQLFPDPLDATNGGGPPLSLEKKDEGKGVLLAVGGDTEGWTVCDGALGQKVVVWKGSDDSCRSRYVQVVEKPPY